MNINVSDYTTSHTFGEIEQAMKLVKFPSRPRPPRPKNAINTAAEAKAFVVEMEAYEAEAAAYEAEYTAATTTVADLQNLWKRKLRMVYSYLNDATFNMLCEFCRTETRQMYEWRDRMEELEPLVSATIKANAQ